METKENIPILAPRRDYLAMQVNSCPPAWFELSPACAHVRPDSFEDKFGLKSDHPHKKLINKFIKYVNNPWEYETNDAVERKIVEEIIAWRIDMLNYEIRSEEINQKNDLIRNIKWKFYVADLMINNDTPISAPNPERSVATDAQPE